MNKRRFAGLALLLAGIALFYWVFGLFLLQCVDWVQHGRWFELPLSTLFVPPGTPDSVALVIVPEVPAALTPVRSALDSANWLLGQPLGVVFSALGALLVVLGGLIYE